MVFATHLKSMLPKKNLTENKRASSLKRFDHFLCVCKGLGTGCVHTLSSHGQKLSGNQEGQRRSSYKDFSDLLRKQYTKQQNNGS